MFHPFAGFGIALFRLLDIPRKRLLKNQVVIILRSPEAHCEWKVAREGRRSLELFYQIQIGVVLDQLFRQPLDRSPKFETQRRAIQADSLIASLIKQSRYPAEVLCFEILKRRPQAAVQRKLGAEDFSRITGLLDEARNQGVSLD